MHIAMKNNIPIYLKPHEYLESFQPNFLLIQLYYLYCKFNKQRPQYQVGHVPQTIWRDHGRIQTPQSSTSHSKRFYNASQNSEHTSSENLNNQDQFNMGTIEEEDSIDFSSSLRSQP